MEKLTGNPLFTFFVDMMVFLNLIFLGFEVDADMPELESWVRIIFVVWYILEMLIRVLSLRKAFFMRLLNWLDLLCVILPVIDVLGGATGGWLWRLSGLRALRLLKIQAYAKTSRSLKDLSLVLDALRRSIKALMYLQLVMIFVFYSAGAWARGLIMRSGGLDDVPNFLGEEYFGSSIRAALTMFQLATLDGWAQSAVRPLLAVRPFEGFALTGFTFVSSYTLVSLALGVLVWSTCEEARSSSDHSDNAKRAEDKEILHQMSRYFEASLSMQDRDFIDLQELKDALLIPEIALGFHQLELPLKDAETLFSHVDDKDHGRVSLHQLIECIEVLGMPATTFDTCCLTARIGGTATFTTRLVTRTDKLINRLQDLGALLTCGIEELTRAAIEDPDLTEVPDIQLRKAGRIRHHNSGQMLRYTG